MNEEEKYQATLASARMGYSDKKPFNTWEFGTQLAWAVEMAHNVEVVMKQRKIKFWTKEK